MYVLFLYSTGGTSTETSIQNGGVPNGTHSVSQAPSATTKNNHRKSLDKGERQEEHQKHSTGNSSSQSERSDKRFVHSNGSTVSHNDIQFIERVTSVNDYDANEIEKDKTVKGGGGPGGGTSHNSVKTQSNGSATGKWNNVKESRDSSTSVNGQRERKGRQPKSTVDNLAEQQKQQDEYCQRLLLCRKLEADIKRLKSDLQSSRQVEQELRSQINTLITGDRQAKGDIQQLQHDNDQLQNK